MSEDELAREHLDGQRRADDAEIRMRLRPDRRLHAVQPVHQIRDHGGFECAETGYGRGVRTLPIGADPEARAWVHLGGLRLANHGETPSVDSVLDTGQPVYRIERRRHN